MVLNSVNFMTCLKHILCFKVSLVHVEKTNAWSFMSPWKVGWSIWKVSWGGSFTPPLFGIHRQTEEGETRWWHQLLRAERRGKLSSGRKVYNNVMKDWELTLLSFPCLQPWSARRVWTDICFWKPILRPVPVFFTNKYQHNMLCAIGNVIF